MCSEPHAHERGLWRGLRDPQADSGATSPSTRSADAAQERCGAADISRQLERDEAKNAEGDADFASRGSVLHGSTTGSKHKPHAATTCFFEPEIRRQGTYFCDLYQILNKSSKNLHNQNVKLSLFRKGYEIGKTAMEIHSPDADSAGIPLYQGAWDAYTRFLLQTVFRNRGRAKSQAEFVTKERGSR